MIEQLSSAKGETRVEQPTKAQRTVGRRSAESRATVPDFQLSAEVELSAPAALTDSLDAVLVRACALALRDVERANGSYRDGSFELHARVNVGVAIEADGAYVMPTVFDADQK